MRRSGAPVRSAGAWETRLAWNHTYGYDHAGKRVKYYDTDGTTPTKHVYMPDGTLMATIEDSDSDATLRYIHTDHLGSTKAVTEDEGARIQMLDYWPFGEERTFSTTTSTSPRSSRGTSTTPTPASTTCRPGTRTLG